MKKMNRLLSIALALTVLASSLHISSMMIFAAKDDGKSVIYWDGTTSQPTSDADGDGYIDITLPSELAWVVANNGNNGGKYELLNDIWINNITVNTDNGTYINNGAAAPRQWYTRTAPSFKGTLNGNGFVVHGLYYNDSLADSTTSGTTIGAGLIPYANNVTLTGIGVEDSYIRWLSNYSTATLIGGAFGSSVKISVDSCYAGESVYLKAYAGVGGILGGGGSKADGYVRISNCYSLASLAAVGGNRRAGGIIGDHWIADNYTVTGCYTNSACLLGNHGATLTGTYNNNYATGADTGAKWTTVAAADMKGSDAAKNMSGLDFESCYSVMAGYPILSIFKKYDAYVQYYLSENDVVDLGIYYDTTFAELDVPKRSGYIFDGFYTDNALTEKAEDRAKVIDYKAVYVKWKTKSMTDPIFNTYDEYGLTFNKVQMPYTKNGDVALGKYTAATSNLNAAFDNGYFSQFDAFVEEGVGVNNSNAMKITWATGYNYQMPTAFRIYDSQGNSFVPEANVIYKMRLKYKVDSLKTGKNLNIVLRGDDGNLNKSGSDGGYSLQYGTFNKELIYGGTTTDGWVDCELTFSVNESLPLFIAVVSTESNKWWAENLQMYIDDIVISQMGYVRCYINEDEYTDMEVYSDMTFAELEMPTRLGYIFEGFYTDKTFSQKISDDAYVGNYGSVYAKWETAPTEFDNTYDEDGFTFNKVQMPYTKNGDAALGKYTAATSNLSAAFSNGYFSQFDAFVEKGVGVNNSNAIKITWATGYDCQLPTAFRIYDSEGNSFVPEANVLYNIRLKYKVDSLNTGKNLNIVLRGDDGSLNNSGSDGGYSLQYGTFNKKLIYGGTTTDGWVDCELTFSVNDSFPLFIAVVSTESNKWWAENLQMYIDDIHISKLGTGDSEDGNGVWNGSLAGSFENGNGTKDDPYIIANAGQLATAVKLNGMNGSYFKLSKDIYLNYVNTDNWYKNSNNNQWFSGAATDYFNGYLNGDGHIVYGIWYADSTTVTSAGLIPNFGKGTIEKIGVRGAYINAQQYGGAIVGQTFAGGVKKIDQCFSDDTVSVSYLGGQQYDTSHGVGGIVGMVWNDNSSTTEGWLQISNCYSKAIINGINNKKMNGIIGSAWACKYTMKNCYSVGYTPYYAVNLEKTASLLEADKAYSNIYTYVRNPQGFEVFTNLGDYKKMVGSKAKTYMPGLDYKNIFEIVSDSTPKLKVFTTITGREDGVSMSGFAGGNGAENNPYLIKTAEQLRKLVESGAASSGKYYELVKDIYINDTTKSNWKNNNPSEWYFSTYLTFMGHLEGNGHSVHGIYLNMEIYKGEDFQDGSAGLFPKVGDGAVIRNVHVRDSYISSYASVGAVAGNISASTKNVAAGNYVKIVGCSADETVELRGQTAGGIVGAGTRGLFLNYCYSTAKLYTPIETNAHGLVGNIWSRNCVAVQCYSVGYVNYRDNFVPSIIRAVYGTMKQTGTAVLAAEEMLGIAAKKNMPLLDWDTAWYTAKGKYPQLNIITKDMEADILGNGEKGKVWSGKIALSYAGGTGTEEDPYIIETAEQLAKCVTDAAISKTYYKVVADIKLNDTSSSDWTAKARNWFTGEITFKGHLEGNAHIVSGLYIYADDGSVTRAALFPQMSGNAYIEKLGIVNSYINVVSGETDSYAGAFTSLVTNYNTKTSTPVTLNQCFADGTVSVEAYYAGGLVGASADKAPTVIENCYYTGSLYGVKMAGAIIGNSWTLIENPARIAHCYATTPDRNYVINNRGIRTSTFEDVYIDSTVNESRREGITYTMLNFMQGNNAKSLMTGFDFRNIWKTVKGGTPVLRAFNTESYSCKRVQGNVKIEFITNGGSACEPIYGLSRKDKIKLPTPTRYGYKFAGWYHYYELDVPCKLEYFPDYDIILYAKWEPTGFTVDFEGSYDSDYDYNSGVQHHKPGTSGYRALYNHNGLKSMHCLADNELAPTFLLSYENKLEVGKEYDMTFWMNTDTAGASGAVELLFGDYPDISAPTVNTGDKIEFSNLASGNWTEYNVTFTANSPYIFFKTPENTSLYFDDVQVIPTENDGTLKSAVEKIIPKPSTGGNTVVITVCCVAGVFLLAGIAALVVVIIKKCRKAI